MKAPIHVRILFTLPFAFALSLWPDTGAAKTVYQYRDQQGAMAFSDTRPTHTNDFIVIDMPDPPPGAAPEGEDGSSSIEEMVEVTERLEAARREREAARREAQQAREPDPPPYPYPYALLP